MRVILVMVRMSAVHSEYLCSAGIMCNHNTSLYHGSDVLDAVIGVKVMMLVGV